MIGAALSYLIMAAIAVAALWRGAPYATIELMVFMVAWYGVRLYLTWGEEKAVKEEKDASRERLLAGLLWSSMVLVPFFALALPILDFAYYDGLPGQIIVGMFLGVIATYAFWCSHRDLGKNWSAHLEVREGHHLVTNGIYSRVRHPMYTAIFLICVAQALILTNWIAGPLALVAFTLLYLTRIGPEEEMMRAQFGEKWDAYAARTPRLLPRIWTS